jgi:signal transduction histidine kinase
MRCIPYRTASNRIDGAVLNFVDISARKKAEIDLKSLNKDLESRVAERIGALHLLQAITVSANNATNINEVLQFALGEICAHMHWPIGHAYLYDPLTHTLFSSGLWHATETEKYRAFRRAIVGFRFGAGDGLPGEVLANRQALWISNIGAHAANQQIRIAMRAGFKSTLLIPVLVQADVPAVLEFLAAETRQPNERLLEVMEQIGMQIGRVFERKRAEAQLKEQERLAAIGTSTAKMAHEINNPLSNIYAAVQFLEQELLRQQESAGFETLSMITDVKREVARLTRLMDDLRTFLVTGRQDPKFEPTNVPALVLELLRLEEPALSQYNIRLVQEVPKVLPLVLGDTNRLKQVLVNLTRNAMEAMPEGGILTVRGYPAGNEVVLEVVDTGRGIPEHLNVLEQPITTKRQGVGIGLLIVRQIVAEHGGTVHYATKPGQGTTFRVTLPRIV